MYGRKILAVLVLVSFQSAHAGPQWRMAVGSGAGKGMTIAASHNPLKDVNEKLTTLSRKLHARMPASAKVEMLRETLEQIDEMRKISPLQTIDKEISMDLSVESLRHVSTDTSFNTAKCSDYKTRLLNDFEPMSEDRPSNPALKRSFSIIEGLCS